ncbi:hypothetical protein [Pseudanabaena yagii]|uniref:Uncharacterized protein n=1 Tax=Pseudanabaena yagii GIHE-NHR1 TaxID=2722753 RepID=A0ABX1LTJ9_9CYAN|nr:hypothetical protein [Pseudanabaena yagii]NMF59493.1 hypothetical protein [Pseudanabaena yagii GIHE-NHR1]
MCNKNIDTNSPVKSQMDKSNNSVHSNLDKKFSHLPEYMEQKTINLSIAELIDESKYLVYQADQLLAIHKNSIST